MVVRTALCWLGVSAQAVEAYKDVALGPTVILREPVAKVQKEAMALLGRVGLADKAHVYPMALSGGQQQRVGIARALAMHPKAVIFDEPTSSLDPQMKREIVNVMEDLAHDGLTMIVVTHELSWVEKMATRIVEFGPECRELSDKRQKESRPGRRPNCDPRAF